MTTIERIWRREGRPGQWSKSGVTIEQAKAAGFVVRECGYGHNTTTGEQYVAVVDDDQVKTLWAFYRSSFRKPGTVKIEVIDAHHRLDPEDWF